jgi:flavodoxin
MPMKKTISVILSLIMMLSLTLTGCAAESETAKPQENTKIVLQIGNPTMVVNGIDKPIDENGTVPVIINDRTLLPVRAVVEEMGGEVAWNGETREVTLNCGENEIKLIIDSKDAYLSGEKTTLDTAPTIINDRTMLPIRFIAESFHFEVKWEETTQTVTIQKTADDAVAKRQIYITVNGTVLTAELADNSSAEKLYELLSNGDITVDMHDYSNFEKVGSLPEELSRNDEQITTEPGDLILYQGNQFVIYYDTNSWNFTRLGKIKDVTQEELKTILGTGNVTAVLSLVPKTTQTPKELVVYFSFQGTTKALAEKVVSATNADVWRIEAKEPYGEENLKYYDESTRAYIEQNNNTTVRPEIVGQIDNLADYDTILLGYPIWYGKAPRIILTFLDTYKDELKGKTIIPFCTSMSSGLSGSIPELKSALPDSDVKDGFRGTDATTEDDIKKWLESNK